MAIDAPYTPTRLSVPVRLSAVPKSLAVPPDLLSTVWGFGACVRASPVLVHASIPFVSSLRIIISLSVP